ncbi:hypothetical protein ACJIZ3_014101 [Penstemon smallii]|uniref:Uncharacterized protein n=1 Tax=Penstemon smallii TaxID=265156 RepID=A0ABD3RIY1_9LAMI
MAVTSLLPKIFLFASTTLLIISTPAHTDKCFNSIISFGDSIADTGNALHISSKSNPPPFFSLYPYGETFFNHPTGRCSDGRLIIDFIAEDLGHPFVEPFHSGGRNASLESVNFAVVGATALEDSFFIERNIMLPLANVSLLAQFSWFKQFLSKKGNNSSDYKRYLQTSLVLVGEIGGNDYNHAFFQGKNVAEVQSFVPKIVKTIGQTINELINLGAVTLMVPGNFPIGCSAAYLTYFVSKNEEGYDSTTGCIKWLNRFAQYHNELLQRELNRIRQLHPETTIIYADYYNAAMSLYRCPEKYGFVGGALKACCGGGGLYNVNFSVQCGYPQSAHCVEPSSYMNWDGVHFTDVASKWIAKFLLRGSYTTPRLGAICDRHSIHARIYDH